MPCHNPKKSRQVPCCQKCQMPMEKSADFATKSDGTRDETCCRHCMHKGKCSLPVGDKMNKPSK